MTALRSGIKNEIADGIFIGNARGLLPSCLFSLGVSVTGGIMLFLMRQIAALKIPVRVPECDTCFLTSLLWYTDPLAG